ncbi:MAG: 3',5'-cyclic-AMP phosphodiesterase [Gammaproteobacteria bacterium]|nr:MAG: 3',5'-cyclic-AMP phosphodiesterase [Gammaproteobacteria bacterium]
MNKKAPFRLIQLSDIHLFADAERELLGVKTEESFQAVIDLLHRDEKHIDIILLSGDISQDNSHEAYVRVARALESFRVPVYCVPGNHDDPRVMAKVYPLATISSERHIVLKNWHIILLNSHKTNSVEGFFEESELVYLQHCLQKYPEHHAIVMFHHQPFPVGSKWLDNLGLQNADEFWRILQQYPQVNTVLFGHVHQEVAKLLHHVKCYAVPSTCIQFKCQDEFSLENIPPGYRWIDLYEDGHIETAVRRVAEYVGMFDAEAKGY